jgi:methionine aminopeptidase
MRRFASHANATHLLIRAGKTSHTAGTLCEIFLKLVDKILKNGITILEVDNMATEKQKELIDYLLSKINDNEKLFC